MISNAHQEVCGGTFVESFAHSCNTVFAPLGVKIGEDKLVQVAESYGWNQTPSLYDQQAIDAVGVPTPSRSPRTPATTSTWRPRRSARARCSPRR